MKQSKSTQNILLYKTLTYSCSHKALMLYKISHAVIQTKDWYYTKLSTGSYPDKDCYYIKLSLAVIVLKLRSFQSLKNPAWSKYCCRKTFISGLFQSLLHKENMHTSIILISLDLKLIPN